MEKEFHIWDFPEDKVRVLLKNHNSFLEECINKFGSIRILSDFLGTSYQNVYAWRFHNLYIPLWALKKIVDKLELDWFSIEESVIAYKGVNLSNPIINPKLPIIESSELFAIIAHLIADGCVTNNGIPIYVNKNRDLANNFIDLVINTFGEVPYRKIEPKKGVFEYRFSKILADLIHFFYNIHFKSKIALLPEGLFNSSNESFCSVIGAIVDDEGSVRKNRIVIGMKNKDLILQIRYLIVGVLGKNSIAQLCYRENGTYYFSIRSGYMAKFNNKVKLYHSDKQKKMEIIYRNSYK